MRSDAAFPALLRGFSFHFISATEVASLSRSAIRSLQSCTLLVHTLRILDSDIASAYTPARALISCHRRSTQQHPRSSGLTTMEDHRMPSSPEQASPSLLSSSANRTQVEGNATSTTTAHGSPAESLTHQQQQRRRHQRETSTASVGMRDGISKIGNF